MELEHNQDVNLGEPRILNPFLNRKYKKLFIEKKESPQLDLKERVQFIISN